MDLDEFEEKYRKKKDDSESEFEGGEELLAQQDIIDAIALLVKTHTLLKYCADVELVKTLTKRERVTMGNVAGEIGDFLDSVAANYE